MKGVLEISIFISILKMVTGKPQQRKKIDA